MSCVFKVFSTDVSTDNEAEKRRLVELQKLCWQYTGDLLERKVIEKILDDMFYDGMLPTAKYVEIRRSL